MLLLDTCTLLWLADGHPRLSAGARRLLVENAGSLFVSAITALEVALKHHKGQLSLPRAPDRWYTIALEAHGIDEIAVDGAIAVRSGLLKFHHRDPADRIIIATALERDLTVLTPDPAFRKYPKLKVEW